MAQHASGEEAAPTWGRGTIVSVSRLASAGKVMGRAIGIGELQDPLEVGQSIKIRLDQGRALAPTAVTRIEVVKPNLVRIETRNHRYELRRVDAALSSHGTLSIENPQVAVDADHRHHETQVVTVQDWPEARPRRFESGARVHVSQTRDDEVRELGDAILLVGLVPGHNTSFTVDEAVISTSTILELIEIDKESIRIRTGNSTYDLTLRSTDEED